MDAVIKGNLPDVDPVVSDADTAGDCDTGEQPRRRLDRFGRGRQTASRMRRRGLGSAIVRTLGRLWIPLVILAVIGAGGFTVSKLHGIFGSDQTISYGDTRIEETKPFNPKPLRYEVFGPPGTLADISYFDGAGEPQSVDGASLPWSVEFPITAATGIGSIAAQGDSDSIGCRIVVDGVVKEEKIVTHEVSSFTSCLLKAA